MSIEPIPMHAYVDHPWSRPYPCSPQVQYLPFPIIAGFLGMVGASIVRGGLVATAMG